MGQGRAGAALATLKRRPLDTNREVTIPGFSDNYWLSFLIAPLDLSDGSIRLTNDNIGTLPPAHKFPVAHNHNLAGFADFARSFGAAISPMRAMIIFVKIICIGRTIVTKCVTGSPASFNKFSLLQ